jgi:hypothetical protein
MTAARVGSTACAARMTYLGGDLVDIYRALSITNERLAIPIAFLGFLQQIAWLLWKFVTAGIPTH